MLREYLKYVRDLEKNGLKGYEISFKDWEKIQAIRNVNHIEVINVCKICNKGFDKQGYKVENPDDYEVDLFVCVNCK